LSLRQESRAVAGNCVMPV